jgi:hypothetical protein
MKKKQKHHRSRGDRLPMIRVNEPVETISSGEVTARIWANVCPLRPGQYELRIDLVSGPRFAKHHSIPAKEWREHVANVVLKTNRWLKKEERRQRLPRLFGFLLGWMRW